VSLRTSPVDLTTRRHQSSPLFPYTTLFRSLMMIIGAPRAAIVSGMAAAGYTTREEPSTSSRSASRASAKAASRTSGRSAWPNERSEEHTSELQSRVDLVCRLLLEKKKSTRD